MASWYFEFIIFFFLITVGAYLVEIMITLKHARRKALGVILMLVLGFSWLVVFYGSFVEPRILVVREFDVSMSETSESSLRAVVLADFHLGPYKGRDWAERVVEKTNSLNPDVVFLVGDFVFDRAEQVDMLASLSQLESRYGVFAVTGNHDYSDNNIDYIIESLKRFGVRVLEDESIELETESGNLVLAGVNDIWFGGSPLSALVGTSQEDTVVLLSHNPDVVLSTTAAPSDLIISGHTHGGQIRLPWYGSVSALPTILGREYDRWLLNYKDEQIFVTSGLGEIGPRARLFNPPEIAVLNIRF